MIRLQTRPSILRDRLNTRRSDRQQHRALAQDLAGFSTQAELLELSALLQRYDDQETDRIRNAVDWARAA
jgi:hypothetical protein